MPAPYSVMISADAALNLDRQQRPTPVQVTLYELKDVAAFQSGDFYTLYEKDAQILAGSMVAKEQIMLQPGQIVTLLRKAQTGSAALGVFVAFRDVEKSVWRAYAALPQAKEIGRFAVLSPSFKGSHIRVKVGPDKVMAEVYDGEVPVIKPGAPPIKAPRMPGLDQIQFPTGMSK